MRESKTPEAWMQQDPRFRENLWPNNFRKGHDTPTTPSTTTLSDNFKKTLCSDSYVIDIACGWGPKLVECASIVRGVRGVGIDRNQREIEWVNKNIAIDGISFVKMDATEIKFPDNTFTHAILGGVLGAVGFKERKKIVEEAFRVLGPGGILASTDFKFDDSDFAKKKYETDKYYIENVLRQTAELGDRIVYGPKHDILFIVRHFKMAELEELFLDVGFNLTLLKEDIIKVVGFEDGKITFRPQYTVIAQKPLKSIR